MKRRAFLQSAIMAAPFLAAAPWALGQTSTRDKELRAQLVIIGASVGGCAAALAACRAGLDVVLTEETDWIGGQLTSQAVPPDEHPWIESFGCTRSYRSYREAVRAFYRDHYPLNAAARANARLNPGNGTVSRLCHEPRVSLAVLIQMLAPYQSAGKLRVLLEHKVTAASVNGDRVEAVTVRDLRENEDRTLIAPYYIDATELGDVLQLAKVEHVIGAEGRKDHGEPHAPELANPLSQQSITSCFALSYHEGQDHTITKPAEYDFWKNYVPEMKPAWPGPLLSWKMSDPISLKERKVGFDPTGKPIAGAMNLFHYRRILDPLNFEAGAVPAAITVVNWPQNDYWLGPILGVSTEEAVKNLARAKQLSLSLVYWMQTDTPRPDGGTGWKGLRLRDDVVGTRDGLAKYAYIRESRRILAEFTVIEQHVSTDFRAKETGRPREEVTAAPFADSVGVGSYRIDLHPDTAGNNYVDLSSLPFQIPLGALIPRRVENLIPACKNLGVTHITNGCYRLHPVEWNIGEAAGALAAFALAKGEPPRKIRNDKKLLGDFQESLRRAGFELEWPKLRPL